MVDQQRSPFSRSLTYNATLFAVAFMLTAALVLLGCDTNEATEEAPEIAEVTVVPDSAAIEVGEQVDFSVVGLTADGDSVRDLELDVDWWSTDPAVFTVEDGGTATGQASGTAFCVVGASDETANATTSLTAVRPKFVGRDSAYAIVFVK